MPLTDVAAELLESLGLEPAEPTPRLFEDLFLRFTALVPYETVSRPPGGAALAPEELFARVLAGEGGGAGAERTHGLLALARGLGFDARLVTGEVRGAGGARPHTAVCGRLDGRDVLADVAFPMPVLLPLDPPARELPSPHGRLSVERSPDGAALLVDGRGRVAERARYALGATEAGAGEGEPRQGPPLLLRLQDDRLLRWRGGAMEIVDPWSRLTYPLPPAALPALRALFAMPDLAFASAWADEDIAGSAGAAGVLTVYDRTELSPVELSARLASPAELLALYPPGSAIEAVEPGPRGWSWTVLVEPGALVRRERVVREDDGISVETLEGETPVARRRLFLQPLGGGTRLRLECELARPVPPAGVGEAVRKTLVFHLVSELLALSR